MLPFCVTAQLLSIPGAPTDTVPCAQPCKMVHANFVKPLETTSYQSSTIAFNPIALTSPSTLSLQDDKFSGAVPIGFPFCFYGNEYNDAFISANGHITFNPSYASGNCSFDTKQGLPFYNATYPDNAIFCPFSDGNTTIGGDIKYKTIGTTPYRKFIVQYSNIPFFGSGSSCTGSPSTFQCVLNETTNIIELFITNKSTCNSDTANWLNYSTLGVQNIGSSSFHVVNNRNASIWTASNEGWRISPAGPPAYTINWFKNSTPLAVNVDSVNICDPFPNTITAQLTLNCPNKVLTETITLYKNNPLIDSIVITKTTCQNSNDGSAAIYASGGTPPYSYSLFNGPLGPNNVLSNLAYGQHTVLVTDANGCTAAQTIFIGTNSTLQAAIDSVISPKCPNNNGILFGNAYGGVPPYSFIWIPGAITTQNLSNIGPGYYVLEVTDALGCKDQIGYLVTWDSLPQATASIIKPVCDDSTGSIDISIIQGNGPFSYSWSNNATTQDVNNLYAGTYVVHITDVNGCFDSVVVHLPDTLDMQLLLTGFTHTSCGLNNGMGSAIAYNGLMPYQFLWSNNDTSSTTNTLGSGWQYVTVTDSNGCVRNDSLNLNPSNPVQINFLHTNAYCDEDNGVINTVIANYTGMLNYLWNTGDTTAMIDSLAAGMYILTVSDSAGCTATDTINLINEGKPKIQVLEYIKPLCYGDSSGRLLLGGVGGAAPYKYSFDGINFTTVALVTSFAAGTYKIYIRDANSCVNDTTIYFDPPDQILIATSHIDTLICYWDKSNAVSFSAQQGTAPYVWSLDGISYKPQNALSGFEIGPNTIYVKDAKGCENELEIIIPGPSDPLEINYDLLPVPCYTKIGGEIDAQINGGWYPYTYSWGHTASQNLLQTDLNAGKYVLSVRDDRNCQLDSVITVEQKYCCDCYFPNAFTPNGDGNNEVFRAISPASDIESYNLSVYNRWGNRVFTTNEISGSWDGTINGEIAPIGTYFFKCNLKCLNKADNVFLKGDVILVR